MLKNTRYVGELGFKDLQNTARTGIVCGYHKQRKSEQRSSKDIP